VDRRKQLAAHAIFFVSGAAGLVYQVVWSRLLNEIFGVTAHAVTAVLATYLGGLALGSWALGRFADRHPRPLRLYGLLELGVGATALAGTWLVRALDPLHAWAAARLAPDSVALLALRILLASLVVLPPTLLMGATLPAMTRAFVERIGKLGREVGFLYALNTAGAVAGSVAAGFALIRALGLHPTLWVAVAANTAVGLAAIALAPGQEGPREPLPSRAASAGGESHGEGGAPRGSWLLAAMALSGFASLSLEVIWTRMLVLVLGTSTYAFVTMLSSFLVGIALGSWLVRPLLDRLADPRRAFGWLQVAIAATTLATLPLVRVVITDGGRWVGALEPRWAGAVAGQFALSFAVMLLPTTLIGATFPLAARIWARGLDTLGGRLGQVYGANTFGNILGALAGGFVLLPAFGMQRGIALLVLANLAAAACALLPRREEWGRPRSLLRSAPVLGGLWTCALLLGAWRPAPLPSTGGGRWDPLRFYREGLVSTVSVFQRADDGRQLVMAVDGITIGQSSAGVDRKQQFLAHVPFLLAQDPPRDVLSIGLGTGILIGEVARHPGVEAVECVELSPPVIEGARLFAEHNGGVLDDPRTRIVNDDGVSFLRRSARTWDAIISDGKSRSGHAGNAVFYSDDFYRSARDHLRDHGVMAQWVPLDVTPEDLKTIVRTFTRAFPHSYLWLGPRSAFMVGLKRPLVLDLDHAQRVLDLPAAAGLRRHGWHRASELAALLLADGPALARWAGEGEVNSIERPVLEFYALEDPAPEGERVARNLGALAALGREGIRDARVVGAGAGTLAQAPGLGTLLDGIARIARGDGRGVPLVEAGLAMAPPDLGAVRQIAAEALFEVGRSLDEEGRLGDAEALYRAATGAWPGLAEGHVNLARIARMQGRTHDARESLLGALAANPLSGSAHRMLGQMLEENGDPRAAIPHLREAVRIAPLTAELHGELGIALAGTGRDDDALQEFREALRLAPDWPAALDRVALILSTNPDPSHRDAGEAIRLATRALDLTGGKDPMALEVAAAAYASAGRFGDAEREERKVLDLAVASGNEALAAAARGTIELYRHGKVLPARAPVGAQ
jgi:spermidine synthase